ncbi:hypothetical protein BDZ89DRAFT_815077 [Hymenopellis radicata]|nr:hypothetical protein BDZ89DRAFT_815077 [Hymenopellis radicata]
MRFLSRFTSRHPTPDRAASTPEQAGVETDGTNTSPSSPQRMDSEGYPSWLPQRPPPPAPGSTFQSSTVALDTVAAATPTSYVGGRKATPRSVRIVSLPDSNYGDENDRRVPTDHTRVASGHLHPRVWSRATGGAVSPTVLGDPYLARLSKPRFNAPSLRLDIVRSNNFFVHLYFHFFRVFIFAHLVLQTFFDFNAIFIIIQVSKFPSPDAPGVPGSGRNWALGAAAYIACWFLQIFGVFILYELVYSFIRRWRVRRPSIYPIYSSSPAFNFVAVTSYSRFCFLQNLRYAAFLHSVRDGLAETFWHYSQNLPTVSLLLPRAGLSLAVFLTFSSPQVAATGASLRDGTFFRDDGSLTGYSRGVLIANAAWTAWRSLILIYSWLGLWVLSEQGCAGICGPRYRWEEDEFEKTVAEHSEKNMDERPPELLWSWRECTHERIQDLFDFCLVTTKSGGRERDPSEDARVTEQVMAAVGLGPHASRRPVLSDDFFKGPGGEAGPSTDRALGEDQGGPLMQLPYPFAIQGSAQVSSDDEKVPFPPSVPSDEKTSDEKETSGGTTTNEDDDEEMDADEEDAEEERLAAGASEEPSSGRASGSMSSLGHPVSSRYPFKMRRPTRGTSMNSSSSPASRTTPQSNTRSLQSRISATTQSTGNRESTDSHSPRSHYTSSDAASAASPSSVMSGAIPMPPRHPNRSRAGTVPIASAPSTPSPVHFPKSRRSRTRADSGITQTFGAPQPGLDLEGEDDDRPDEPEVETCSVCSPRSPPASVRARPSSTAVAPAPHPPRITLRPEATLTLGRPLGAGVPASSPCGRVRSPSSRQRRGAVLSLCGRGRTRWSDSRRITRLATRAREAPPAAAARTGRLATRCVDARHGQRQARSAVAGAGGSSGGTCRSAGVRRRRCRSGASRSLGSKKTTATASRRSTSRRGARRRFRLSSGRRSLIFLFL